MLRSNLIHFAPAFPSHLRPLASQLTIVPAFLSPHVHDCLATAAQLKLKRLARGPYLEGHFDAVIKGYKEATVSAWALPNSLSSDPLQDKMDDAYIDSSDQSVNRILRHFEATVNAFLASHNTPTVKRWLSPHVLDLRDGNSGIGAHVDHKSAFGDVIAGLCLISPAVMRFRHIEEPAAVFDVLLPPGCMYIQTGSVRHMFTHEIPISPLEHSFNGKVIERKQRISIMVRDGLDPAQASFKRS
ncbi:Alpha-ketoglutarate-dependent dioxygenase alkB 7, mitochondrial [Chytriomyces hyalinus]|nr:Alpha-ketoglutarate-dependent dioxygenase alkB 7, mitochondrial [Chytriomyces hyalinus]